MRNDRRRFSLCRMTPVYLITTARSRDLAALPSIELAAASLFDGHVPSSIPMVISSEAELALAQTQSLLWVALADDAVVGFAHVKMLEPSVAHLEELDVHPAHGRQGLGRRLVMAVCDWAAGAGHEAVTLTTFRDPPWNMPFYASLGFVALSPDTIGATLAAIVREEARRGLDPALRVAMRRPSARHR
jgi:GNAT superfamily N-acetyltransferase